MFFGSYPTYACGQFLINCLSLADELCPVGNDDMISSCMAGIEREQKFSRMIDALPRSSDSYWHERFYNSTRWYSNVMWARSSMDIDDQSTGTIAAGLTRDMRPYMDLRWREQAIQVSKSQLGFFLPAHDQAELNGWINLFGDRKQFSVGNYYRIRKEMMQRKTRNDVVLRLFYEEGYKQDGFVFDLERLIEDDDSFVIQMKDAYDYFGMTGFDSSLLKKYKRSYLVSCLKFLT